MNASYSHELAAVDFDLENESHSYAEVRDLLKRVCNSLSSQLESHGLRIDYYIQETPGGPIEMISVKQRIDT